LITVDYITVMESLFLIEQSLFFVKMTNNDKQEQTIINNITHTIILVELWVLKHSQYENFRN